MAVDTPLAPAMAGGAGQRAPAAVSDFLNGLPSGSSGRSSVSLNSLLSGYLQEMQELAEGKLLSSSEGRDHTQVRGATDRLCWSRFSRLTEQGCLRLLSAHCAPMSWERPMTRGILRHRRGRPWRWTTRASPTILCSPWSSFQSHPATPVQSLVYQRFPACRGCLLGRQVSPDSASLRDQICSALDSLCLIYQVRMWAWVA